MGVYQYGWDSAGILLPVLAVTLPPVRGLGGSRDGGTFS